MGGPGDDDSLSEDDAVFTESDGERLDYSGSSSSEAADSENEVVSKRRKVRQGEGKKKAKRSRFVETEAAVGEDSEDDEERDRVDSEEEEEDDDDGFVDNDIEEREKEFSAAFERRLAAHAARREAAKKNFEEELDPEMVEERLKRLYGRTRHVSGKNVGATEATMATVLQPQPSDPKLWLVKCRPGKERAAVAALLRGLTILGDSLGVFSVIGRDSLKGFIYVEAHKVNDVMNAVQKTKLNYLIFASPMNRPVMVPLSEMADVMAASMASSSKSSADASAFTIGGWVRVKRGKYAGDLAQVVEVDQETTGEGIECIVRVKLLPRLSYRKMTGGKNERPSAKPFDPQEAAQYGSVTKARGYWLFNSEAYKDGFLFKEVRGSSLNVHEVGPRPDELERFGALSITEEGGDAIPDSMLIKHTKGEAIVVTRGEFQHMSGIVDAEPEGDMISVRFDDESFKESVMVPAKSIRRKLDVGNMIRIALGDHAGKSGIIVSILQSGGRRQAVVFLMTENQQITVPLTHLTTSGTDAPIPARPEKTGDSSFEIHDLVTIENDDGEAGVILRILSEEQHASILDVNGQTRKVSFKNLRKVPKPSSQGPVKFDPSVLKSGDRVQIASLPGQEPRPATIIHVFRTHAFLHTIDTGEVLCRAVSSLSRPAAYPGIGNNREQRSPSRGVPPMRHLIGKSVTIGGAGPYKGYVGIVKDMTDTIARVELHTDSRVVNVARERIALPGADTGPAGPGGRWGAGGKTPAWTDSRTPAWGAQSSKTPAWGAQSSKTPAWGAQSSKTPAWGAQSSKTPAWGAQSSKTPAWGATSSKTPAWGATSSKTPAWGGNASRTPAVHDGGKTPVWQSGASKSSSVPAWIVQDAELTNKSGAITGRVLSVLPSGMVQLSGHSEPMSSAELVPVPPSKKDSVRLLNDDRATGTVIGLDGPDAVIRVDGTADFRIVPINSLVKIIK
ncbi:Transcription elongation factor Spt5 [Paramicrosporidium saccamoebae]|uniref:Transcription elongation factor SPT5 n=1 Tax=Paramicrosporidium saccamoebae TaxID=1246581 RepID=A0A2H9TL83_9FUNG|nr:Transcription elongation factor Spt5 [Paramicrosporidium saccamoebae]